MRRTSLIASAKRRIVSDATPGVAYSTQVLADSPLVYYRLADTSGTTAVDSATTPHNGTIVGTPTYGVTGGIVNDTNTAMTFSGSQRITVPAFTELNTGATYTVECLAKLSGTSTYALVDRDINGSRQFQFRMNGGRIEAIVFSNNTTNQTIISTATYNDNNWHHFVLRRAGNAASVWVDGAKVAETLTLANAAQTGTGLLIGASNGGTTAGISIPLIGSIDEVAYYPTALTDTRIGSHATARSYVS